MIPTTPEGVAGGSQDAASEARVPDARRGVDPDREAQAERIRRLAGIFENDPVFDAVMEEVHRLHRLDDDACR